MRLISNFLAIIGLLVAFTVGVAPSSARAEQRIALVLGNAAYETGALKTPANDAGLIAQTLEAAGFDVIGARDLDNDALRRAFRDFVDKAAALGPDGVAVLYLGGYGLQLEGENYFVPVDARIERASDIPVRQRVEHTLQTEQRNISATPLLPGKPTTSPSPAKSLAITQVRTKQLVDQAEQRLTKRGQIRAWRS